MEKRKFQRYDFESGKRPFLKIGNEEFPIENISQGGVKFVKDKDLNFDDIIHGSIVFPDGESIPIEGNIAWEQEDVIGLSFEELIPEGILDKKQQVAFLQTKISIPKLTRPDNFEVTTGYSMQDVIKIGIPLDRLEEWIRKGYVLPISQDSSGSGVGKIFGRFDLYAIKLFDYLINRAFSEMEAAIRTRIMILAEKKPGRYLYKISFLAFSRKVDFSTVSNEMQKKMLTWLTDKENLEEEERGEVKDSLKKFVPTLIQEKDGKLSLSSSIYEDSDDILIVNFKNIRDQVDRALGDTVVS